MRYHQILPMGAVCLLAGCYVPPPEFQQAATPHFDRNPTTGELLAVSGDPTQSAPDDVTEKNYSAAQEGFWQDEKPQPVKKLTPAEKAAIARAEAQAVCRSLNSSRITNPELLKKGVDLSVGWGSLTELIWDARQQPQKGRIYNISPIDGVKVQQVTHGGVLVTAAFGPPETSDREVFLYKSREFGGGLVDGGVVPSSCFQYSGVMTYTTVLGASRTVYAFRPID